MPTDDALRPTLSRGFAALVGVTWCLLVFGATVRVHGAGLSCPDWPLCYGRFIPHFDPRIFLEWGHRVLASLVALGFAGLGAVVWFRFRDLAGGLVLLAGGVLIVQIVLGGLTVLKLLAVWSVTLHLLCGNAFMVMLLLIQRRLASAEVPLASAPSGWALALGAGVVIQLALGGLTSSSYAGLACTEWPTCNAGVWVPTTTGIVGLHLLHRAGGYALLVLAFAFAIAMRHDPHARRGWAIAGLVVLQAAIGIANVLLALPAELAVAHAAVADVIVLVTAYTLHGVFVRPRAALVAEPA